MAAHPPSFSMGSKLAPSVEDFPGPGAYGGDNFIKPISPKAVPFHSGVKNRLSPHTPISPKGHMLKIETDDLDHPGPGTHSPSHTHTFTSTAKFSFAANTTWRSGVSDANDSCSKRDRFASSQTLSPGPGTYKSSEFEPKGPKQPFGLRPPVREPEYHANPAPHHYDTVPTEHMAHTARGGALENSPRFNEPLPIPGVGSYNVAESKDRVHTSPSKYTMRPAPGGRLIMTHPDSPGPGTHEFQSCIKPSPPKVGPTAKRFVNPDNGHPGVGDYTHPTVDVHKPKSPVFSMRPQTVPTYTKPETITHNFPGPGCYDQTDFTLSLNSKQSQRINSTLGSSSFGFQPRFKSSETLGKGPHGYEPKIDFSSVKPSPPKQTMSPRTTRPDCQYIDMYASKGVVIRAPERPGPGTYDPSTSSTFKRTIAIKMGLKLKPKQDPTPGPGAYDTRPKEHGPKYSMATKLKEPKKPTPVWEAVYFPDITYMGAPSKLGHKLARSR